MGGVGHRSQAGCSYARVPWADTRPGFQRWLGQGVPRLGRLPWGTSRKMLCPAAHEETQAGACVCFTQSLVASKGHTGDSALVSACKEITWKQEPEHPSSSPCTLARCPVVADRTLRCLSSLRGRSALRPVRPQPHPLGLTPASSQPGAVRGVGRTYTHLLPSPPGLRGPEGSRATHQPAEARPPLARPAHVDRALLGLPWRKKYLNENPGVKESSSRAPLRPTAPRPGRRMGTHLRWLGPPSGSELQAGRWLCRQAPFLPAQPHRSSGRGQFGRLLLRNVRGWGGEEVTVSPGPSHVGQRRARAPRGRPDCGQWGRAQTLLAVPPWLGYPPSGCGGRLSLPPACPEGPSSMWQR